MSDPVQQRPTRIEIDLDAFAHNHAAIRAHVGVPVMGIVKANAYGHGLVQVARHLQAQGVDQLGVAFLEEGVALRRAGITAPILVYAGTLADAGSVAVHEEYSLMPSLHDEASFAGFAQHLKARVRVAVKVDIGPERIGVPLSQAREFIRRVHAHPRMELFAVHAHPNVQHGDGEGVHECMQWQYDRFVGLHQELRADGIDVPWFALASSKVLRRNSWTWK